MKPKYISVMLIFAIVAAFVSGSVYANGADPRQTYYDFSQPPTGAEAERAVTRAEFSGYLTAALAEKGILAKNGGEPAFNDVAEDSDHYQDIAALKELSIVTGDGDGNFRPDDNITYIEVAAMISRLMATDDMIAERYGAGWPDGPLYFSWEMGLFNGAAAAVEHDVTLKDAYTMLNNLDNFFNTYDLMERLGCDTYNGEVYIDYYPKEWQGVAEKPAVSVNGYSNGYFKILPSKLLYSYDNQEWHTAYEDIDGERVFYDLPEDIEGVRYAWEYGAFVNSPFSVGGNSYSYDYKTWHEGEPQESAPVSGSESAVAIEEDSFIMGIEKEAIISEPNSGLYFYWSPYEETSYLSARYNETLWKYKYSVVWVSNDCKRWIGVRIPDSIMYFVGAGLNLKAEALQIDGAVPFTDEESAYIQSEAETAESLGLGYDVPEYKTETYMLYFDDLLKTLDDLYV